MLRFLGVRVARDALLRWLWVELWLGVVDARSLAFCFTVLHSFPSLALVCVLDAGGFSKVSGDDNVVDVVVVVVA